MSKSKTTKKEKKSLVSIQSAINPEVKFMVASELADDSLIASELSGAVLPHYIYRFVDKSNKEQVGLSVFGVRESVRLLNRNPKSGLKIRLNPQYRVATRDVEQNGEKGVEVWVYAEDLINGTGAWGVKFEPYMKQGRNGAYANKFALEVALSKAERNAQRKLIPERGAIEMIKKLLNTHGEQIVQTLSAPLLVEQSVKSLSKPEATKDMEQVFKKVILKCKTKKELEDLRAKLMESPKYENQFKIRVADVINQIIYERFPSA